MLPDNLYTERGMNALKTRDHLCLIYGSEEEWSKAVPGFITDGLKRGEKCLYIHHVHKPADIKKYLTASGIDIYCIEKTGQFVFYSFEGFIKNCETDPYAIIYFLSKLSEATVSEGYTALRISMEMKGFLKTFSAEAMLQFEARLNRYLFSKYPCLMLCQYDQREIDPKVIKDIIITHPLIAKEGRLYCNSHYMIPSEILSSERGKNEIDNLLNLIERDCMKNESLGFLKKIFNESLQSFCAIYANGLIMACNLAFCQLTGYTTDQLYETFEFSDLIPAAYLDVHANALEMTNATGQAQRYEVEMLKQDGCSIFVEILLHMAEDRNINRPYYYMFLNNVTERKESEQRLADIINFLPDPTMVIDKIGQVIAWNKAIEKMTGVKAKKVLGKGDYEHAVPIYGEKRPMLIDQVLNRNKHGQYYTSVKKEGKALFAETLTLGIRDQEVYLWGKATPLYDVNGEIVGSIESIRDITEFKLTEERLRFLSQRDSLTGLYNRGYFEEEMRRLETDQIYLFGAVGIIVCDVDGLKEVNDTLGHQKGDELLITAARLIREPFREDDMVARIGGDEFAVLLPNSPVHAVERASHRIRRAVEWYNEKNPEFSISISVGFAVSNHAERKLRELFIEADNNMYREKLHHIRSPRSSVVNILMKALEARDFITEGHADRLQRMVVELGKSLGLPENSLGNLRLFAQFHDIGKIGIPDRILFKPEILTPEEIFEMRRHCEIGYQIAQSAPALSHIADWVLKHHEWWDGSGYPIGLKGKEIPLECRLLSIVDAYDAMTSDRPYRKAMPKELALSELRKYSGSQFDPYLVNRFIQVLQNNHGYRVYDLESVYDLG